MREALFIVAVILFLFGLTAFRYRRQIVTVVRIWQIAKRARAERMGPREPTDRVEVGSEPLVNCAKCGAWVSEGTAIRLGKTTFFCSTACFEKQL